MISNVPFADRYIIGWITADKEGNIWIGDLLGKGLYAYNVARSGAGSTTIMVTDVYGNGRYEPVSVTM